MATSMSMRKIRKRRPRKRRPPTLTCEGGVLTYRSKPMTLEQARRLALLKGGDRRWAGVEICQTRSKLSWFVKYLPANTDKIEKMHTEFVRQQKGKWQDQRHLWEWTVWPNGKGATVRTWKEQKGELVSDDYEVCDDWCTCPHYEYHLKAAGEDCKHMEGWKAEKDSLLAERVTVTT